MDKKEYIQQLNNIGKTNSNLCNNAYHDLMYTKITKELVNAVKNVEKSIKNDMELHKNLTYDFLFNLYGNRYYGRINPRINKDYLDAVIKKYEYNKLLYKKGLCFGKQ